MKKKGIVTRFLYDVYISKERVSAEVNHKKGGDYNVWTWSLSISDRLTFHSEVNRIVDLDWHRGVTLREDSVVVTNGKTYTITTLGCDFADYYGEERYHELSDGVPYSVLENIKLVVAQANQLTKD